METQNLKRKNQSVKFKELANFLFEANTLKRIKRTGWQILAVKDESVAEHMWVTAVIGYVLAKMAKANLEDVILMCLFHNFYEVRLGDLNSINKLYLERKKGKKQAEKDIFLKLPFGKEIISLLKEYEERKTKEGKLAVDASHLSFLIQLKEFIDKGDKHAWGWFDFNKNLLSTQEAKKLAKEIEKTDMEEWWGKLKERIKAKSKEPNSTYTI